ncbi:MAG: hypothetical protein WCR55_04335 [Lentisphaerota bacterium]
MIKIKRYTLLSLFFLLIAVGAGCRSPVPVANVNNEPFLSATKNADLDLVTEAILEAGKERKFRMEVIAPGHIEAVYVKRNIRAVMDIKYTTENFSITYQDSSNLNYDSATNTINGNYNKWVNNLRADIANIYPLASSTNTASKKSQDKTSAELMPPKPELTDSM